MVPKGAEMAPPVVLHSALFSQVRGEGGAWPPDFVDDWPMYWSTAPGNRRNTRGPGAGSHYRTLAARFLCPRSGSEANDIGRVRLVVVRGHEDGGVVVRVAEGVEAPAAFRRGHPRRPQLRRAPYGARAHG